MGRCRKYMDYEDGLLSVSQPAYLSLGSSEMLLLVQVLCPSGYSTPTLVPCYQSGCQAYRQQEGRERFAVRC